MYRHIEPASDTSHTLGNMSESIQSERAIPQFSTDGAIEMISLHVDHHTKYKFGNGIRVLSRGVHNTNISQRGSCQIHVIVTCTRAYRSEERRVGKECRSRWLW